MAKQQRPPVAEERSELPLNERISNVFAEHFSMLDSLQSAKKVAQKDLDRLEAAKVEIQDCERRANGGVDEGSKVFLGQLRELLDAASSNVNDRAEFVEDGGKKGKREKKKEPVRRERDEDEEQEQRRSARSVAEGASEEKINVKQEARYWGEAVGNIRFELQQMSRALLSYDNQAATEEDEKYFVQTLGSAAVEFAEMINALGRSGATEVPEILRPVVADFALANEELAALRDRIARFDELKKEREEAAKSAEGLAKTFIESAKGAKEEIPRILALPSNTPEERFILRSEIEGLVRNFKAYNDEWEANAKPHLPNGEEWLPAWKEAMTLHAGIHRMYREGIKPRRDQLEGDRVVDFEKNRALFEGKVSVFRTRLLEAQTKTGDEREVFLRGLRDHFMDLKDEWQNLRQQSPRLTREERDALSGEDTPVRQLDRAIGSKGHVGGLERNLEELMAEKDARVLKSYEVIADLARAVVRAHGDIWVASTRYPARDGFLRRYLDGEVKDADPEFAEFVVNRERFQEAIGPLSVAYLQVSRERRVRQQREERRQSREAEREERQRDIDRRRSIRHPWVVDLRAREQDRFARILYSESWKIPDIRERRKIMDRVAEMTDEALAEKLENAPAFRAACAELLEAKAAIRNAETEILEGRELRPDVSKQEAQAMVERYHKLRRMQSAAGRKLAQSRAWNPRVRDRFAAAVAFRGTLFANNPRNVVRDAFREIARDPRELSPLMERWIDSTSERYALGQAIDFILEIHPELRGRGVLRGLPKEFRPAQARPQAGGAEGEAGGAAEDEADADAEAGEDVSGFGGDLGGSMGSAADLMSGLHDDAGDDAAASAGVVDRAREAVPAYGADGGAPRTPDVVSPDARREALSANWKVIRKGLANNIFWNDDVAPGTRATKIDALLRRTVADARMVSDHGIREGRLDDFYRVSAFADFADFERRLAEAREKYTEAAPAVAAPVVESPSVPVPEPSAAQIMMGPPSGEAPVVAPEPRPVVPVRRNIALPPSPAAEESAPVAPRVDVPRPPRPDDVAPAAPVRSEPASAPRAESASVRSIPAPAGESDDPFARFFGGGAEAPAVESRPVARTETPRPPRGESAPVPSARPVARPEPVAEPVAPTAARVEIPIEAPVEGPRETHAEDRVASWSRSLRNTFGRFFGGAAATPSVAEVPAVRTESVPSAEVSRRTAGGVVGVLGRFFGLKAFADVPQYLPESFGDQNARALLQADILDAMEENAATMKNVAGDPDRIHAANLEASERLDRAIATSTLSNEAKMEMRNRVVALQEKYTERTRENAVARSRELAGIVEQQVRVLEAPGRRGSLAMRLLSKLPFGVGTNLAHGVGDFRKRFETAVSRGGDAGLVARVATVFRETWEEAMQGIRASGSLSDRAMNTAEAVAMIGSAYGVSATVTALEQILPSLRSLSGSERDEMSRLMAEGRLNVQEAVDGVLPRAEQAMRRAA